MLICNWDRWKQRLDELYRLHTKQRNTIELKWLDALYDKWQAGDRNREMIDILIDIDHEDFIHVMWGGTHTI